MVPIQKKCTTGEVELLSKRQVGRDPKRVKGNEKSSAGGRVNAAGSEFGLTVPGLSNRSLYPPASKVCAGA